ncbi:efflux transporter outer membrane subunit [Frateuria aurantia]
MTDLLRKPTWLALGLAMALSGCTVGPDFKPPQAKLPHAWQAAAGSAASQTFGGEVDMAWWRSFQDPELSSLVGRLAAQNFDLAIAAERVSQGRAERRAAASEGLPHVGVSGDYARTRQSPNGFLKLVQPRAGAPVEYNFFEDALSASWELDLFGRVRRTVEMAQANSAAAVEERRAVALAAVSDLALDYMQLRSVQARLVIVRQSIALSEHNTALVRQQMAYGTGSDLDLAEAQEQETATRALLPQLETDQSHLINAISLLLALPPHALEAELSAPSGQPVLPAEVPTGLPSQLARRRPDIREAEDRLHAATAGVGVAVASFYPDLSLTGQFGMQALQFSQLGSTASAAGSIGPALSIPLFEGGRLKAQLHLRKSQQREAAIAFQQTVLKAWHEVDDALVAYRNVQQTRDQVAATLTHADKALQIARQRYADGTEDFLNVIAAQRAYLDASSGLAISTEETETDLVRLYKALGGGWQYAEDSKETI